MQALPGFRDFYPADHARRAYLFEKWRETTGRYAFSEVDGPTLESLDLYRKKSGNELFGQLFNFTDRGDREVTLRPEMTPTLARMVAAKHRDFRKPLRWFSIAQFFRYERTQKGRLREFCQLNCDLIGETGPGAEAEMVALLVDLMRSFGFSHEDVKVRVNSREFWRYFAESRNAEPGWLEALMPVIDKLNFDDVNKQARAVEEGLAALGLRAADLVDFAASAEHVPDGVAAVLQSMEARGLADYVEFDPRIVRGLAYYTGFVFEAFDVAQASRAIAGGGRYDDLIAKLSDGGADLPALGFGMGDVVLLDLIDDTPHAKSRLEQHLAGHGASQIYLVIADEERRSEALGLLQKLRASGFRVDFPLAAAKVGKQFQSAEASGASHAVVLGSEYPALKVKHLASREERLLDRDVVIEHLLEIPELAQR